MSIKIPNSGEVLVLQALVSYLNTLTLHLYQNDVTPTDAWTIASVVEATFPGYAAVVPGTFGAAFTNSANQAESDAALVTFTSTGASPANTIFGYYLTNPAGALVYAERNPLGGQLIDAAGQSYPVLLKFTFETKF